MGENKELQAHGTYFHSNALETAIFADAAEDRVVFNILVLLLQPSSGIGDIIVIPISDLVTNKESLSFSDLQGRLSKRQPRKMLLGWQREGQSLELNPVDKAVALEWDCSQSDQLLVLSDDEVPKA